LPSVALLTVVLVAISLIVVPSLGLHARHTPQGTEVDLRTIDPQSLVPTITDLPRGTRLQTQAYVSTVQAAQRNGTSLALLRHTGREVGFTRDFLVPQHGDIEVEVVRFHTHPGLMKGYAYFLTLPASRGLPDPVRAEGIGERAAVVATSTAAFVEFMRGRYYVVVTAIPGGPANLTFIGRLAHAVDQHVQTHLVDT
jgi:hypothetical protein